VNHKQLERFVEIYKQHYGIELTDEDARKIADEIIALYRIVYGDPLLE